ncbi:MAG: peptide ABC transporter substrate-binding protein [Eubacteriales bacterium]|nr:peptide ABC transporter substrate-binding protein [Christensenellaceae bacterium]MEA5065470.1 peptide ABC transporter substrate-binding protein [Eubacteriales bacterium]
MKRKLRAMLAALLILAAAFGATASAEPNQIIFALQNEPDGIDPGVTNNSFASPFLANCFEGLVTYDTTTGSLIGGNAESWTISDDGTVYTFKLRQGLKWSDGSALTAQDYVYAYQRILKPETTAQYVSLLTEYIKGAQEYYDGAADAEALGIVALDDNTLELTLKSATPFFIDVLTMWTFSPVQQATVERNGDRWTASPETYVCNGAFMISEMNLGESVVLTKNPNYYDADAVKLEKITFRYISDPSTALLAYEAGEIDGSRTVPPSDYARLKADGAGVVAVASYGTVFYNFNCAKAPFDNPLVRKAFSLAIDRSALINDVVQVDALPAYSNISPGYSIDGVDFVDGRSEFGLSADADMEGAKAALAEAGYPDGALFPEITLSYYTNENVKKIVEAMAEMLKTNLNVPINIINEEWSVYYPNVQAGNFDLCAMGWSGDYVHPMTFLPLLVTGDVNNLGKYSNADYDALVAQAQVETDSVKAMEIMREADALASAEYPTLTLYYKTNTMLMKDKVQGYYLNPSDMLYLKTAEVVG